MKIFILIIIVFYLIFLLIQVFRHIPFYKPNKSNKILLDFFHPNIYEGEDHFSAKEIFSDKVPKIGEFIPLPKKTILALKKHNISISDFVVTDLRFNCMNWDVVVEIKPI